VDSFTPRQRYPLGKSPPPSTRWIGGRIGPRAGLDAERKKKKICPSWNRTRIPSLADRSCWLLSCDHQLSVPGRDQVSPSKKEPYESADAAATAAAACRPASLHANIVTCLPKAGTVEITRRPLLGNGFVNTIPLQPNHVTGPRNDYADEDQQQFSRLKRQAREWWSVIANSSQWWPGARLGVNGQELWPRANLHSAAVMDENTEGDEYTTLGAVTKQRTVKTQKTWCVKSVNGFQKPSKSSYKSKPRV
jgi:hypothetical protein